MEFASGSSEGVRSLVERDASLVQVASECLALRGLQRVAPVRQSRACAEQGDRLDGNDNQECQDTAGRGPAETVTAGAHR